MSSVFSLRLVFALNALGIALWFPRIPDVKAALDVDLFTLSLCFFMLPAGTGIGFFSAPAMMARYGARRLCRTVGPAFITLLILPALARNALELGAALFLAGLCIASIEVAMNAKANELERMSKRRIMAGCHGAWSLGSMSGALLGGSAAALGLSFAVQQLTLAPIFAALAYFAASALPPDQPGTRSQETPRLTLPKGALLAVCVLPMGALMLEGAMMEWSALFLRGEVGTGPFAAGATYAAFSLTMAVSRFLGDGLITRHGTTRIMSVSCILAALGTMAFALSPTVAFALPAAVVLGAGIANIYPLSMSRASEVPGPSEAENIATVAFVGFTTFMVAPPLIGSLGHLFGLGTALLMLTPVALYPLLILSQSLTPMKEHPEDAPT
ncbi:MFS transporter [Oceanibium sediminis]|uniref:MFS transporter n=1 Tax=Oceanibium sediminis TaxID=2026339 RepID=UPI001300A351|nr:MFS transporter [Oceanibium sediminis]